MDKAEGVRMNGKDAFGGTAVVPPNDRPTLKDMGLSKNLSSKFQQLAGVPENEFTSELEKLDGTKKTTAVHCYQAALYHWAYWQLRTLFCNDFMSHKRVPILTEVKPSICRGAQVHQ
jgi:hypothetical protein